MNILGRLFRKTEINHMNEVVSKLQRRISELETLVSEMQRREKTLSNALEVEKAKVNKLEEENQRIGKNLMREQQMLQDAKVAMGIAETLHIPMEQILEGYGAAKQLKERLKELEGQCQCGCQKCNPSPLPCTCGCHDCCQVVPGATSSHKITDKNNGDDDSDDAGPRVRPIQSPGTIFGDGPGM